MSISSTPIELCAGLSKASLAWGGAATIKHLGARQADVEDFTSRRYGVGASFAGPQATSAAPAQEKAMRPRPAATHALKDIA